MEGVMSLFRKKGLPWEYQVRIVTNQFTKDELQNLMREHDLTATELNLVANAFRTMDELDLAERTFKESISKEPGYDEAYGNLLSLYCLQERYDEGRALLDDALKHARKHSFVWYHFGRMCALSGDLDSALNAAYLALQGENYQRPDNELEVGRFAIATLQLCQQDRPFLFGACSSHDLAAG
jgi:tetratricopeptide (TPR) repeat protein